MTHDLACALVDALAGEVVRVTVTELRENTFHAQITLSQSGTPRSTWTRARRTRSRSRCAPARRSSPSDEVIEESGVEFEDGEPDFEQIHVADGDEDVDWGAFRRFLDTVTPDEFALGDDEPTS